MIGNGNVLESESYEELMEQKGVFLSDGTFVKERIACVADGDVLN